MSQITLKQAASWCGGWVDPKFENVTFLGANNDTRRLQRNQLFVALEGLRDGHDFIDMAFEKGAAAVLCKHCDSSYPAIIVDDPRIALGRIAAGERQRIGMKTVAVTGSVGKSTTKEMIAAVLSGDYIVSKTPANFNNDLGMPMSLLAMDANTEVAVLEMGMSHFGEIAYLSHIGKPDVAVIINVGVMHMENLGSREGVLQAKLEILEGLQPNGKAFFCGDNDMLRNCRPGREVTYFGTDSAVCAVCGSKVRERDGVLSFDVTVGERQFSVDLPLEGTHYVCDALAAVAVGLSMGVSPENIALRLSVFQNMAGRQEIFTAKGCTIIKDCYNAGPESMAAALSVLGRRGSKRIAVLGDMLELGAQTLDAHVQTGVLAAKQADILLAYGPNAGNMVAAAVENGMAQEKALIFDDRGEMAKKLKELVAPGDTLLFKGSHGMHMELVLEQFLQEETDAEE